MASLLDRPSQALLVAFRSSWKASLADVVTVVDRAPVPLRPVFISERQRRELENSTSEIVKLAERFVRQELRAGDSDTDYLRTLSQSYPLPDGPLDDDLLAFQARPDVLVAGDGVKIIELNVSASYAGPVELSLMHRVWRQFVPEIEFDVDPLLARASAIADVIERYDLVNDVAVIGVRDEIVGALSPRYLDLEADALRQMGVHATVKSPAGLDRELSEGTPPSSLAIRRFTNYEWEHRGISTYVVRKYAESGAQLICPQRSNLLAEKRNLAWLWQGRPWMGPAELATCRNYLPWAAVVSRGPALGPDSEPISDVADYAARNQNKLVLKESSSLKGDDVYIGKETSAELWSAILQTALSEQSWVVQQLVDSVAFDVPVSESESDVVSIQRMNVVFGPMLNAGSANGIYCRMAPAGTNKITGVGVSDIETSAVSENAFAAEPRKLS